MSNPLAISGVTAVLQYLLNSVYTGPGWVLGSVTISAVAPDIVQTSFGSGASTNLQVNLFLHQVTPSAAWRNAGMPSLAADGATLLKNQPLALDLHYLLTAYAGQDSEAEALLGYAALLLHENPMLPRAQINNVLAALPGQFPGNPLYANLATSGLADQIEMLKVTPSVLGREEMAWLWTALKADYRPTFPFQVSVVLIDAQFPTAAALPVLSRDIVVQPGPPAQLLDIQPPAGKAAPAAGDSVTLTGQSLWGATQVVLYNARLSIRYTILPSSVTGTSVTFTVTDDPANLPAGVYQLRVLFTNASGVVLQSTNTLAFALAPTIVSIPPVMNTAQGTLVSVNCDPQVFPQQSVSLALDSTAVPAVIFDNSTPTPVFQFPTLAPGSYVARLLVDGVESASFNATI